MALKNDAVELILSQWRRERPDLDVEIMGPIGRINRCAMLLEQRLDACFAEFGLCLWEFDVLAALRRSGTPYCLSPTVLFSTLMVTSGTMTHRLKRLESKGWIVRLLNEQDARSMLVQLTDVGVELINKVVAVHVDNERQMLATMAVEQLAELDQHLSTLLQVLEPAAVTPK
ncbi:MAG: MarR family winged helix-turn-helix transcriptional regulator [Paenalcaligenes sp.]